MTNENLYDLENQAINGRRHYPRPETIPPMGQAALEISIKKYKNGKSRSRFTCPICNSPALAKIWLGKETGQYYKITCKKCRTTETGYLGPDL